jgi:hypothetical protein
LIHKAVCGLSFEKYFEENKETITQDDFEVIKKLGDGNFTEVFKVTHKKYPSNYLALKICTI